MKHFFLIVLLFPMTFFPQEEKTYNFYIRAVSSDFNPNFERNESGYLNYKGDNENLAEVLKQSDLLLFEKAFPSSVWENISRVFRVETLQKDLLYELLREFPDLFEFGEYYEEPVLNDNYDEKSIAYFPNDYLGGIGLNIDSHNLDFLGMPEAWEYTTGSTLIKIGISDAIIDSTDLEFVHKITMIPPFSTSNLTHGNSVASIAAAQGDNNYGITGVCYDCDIIHTQIGVNAILVLAQNGASVVNCSWVLPYIQTHEQLIDSIYNTYGTIIVAASGNEKWSDTGGNFYRYPASYDKVISVGSIAHRYETVYDNIGQSANGNYYALNIKNYVGGSIGFTNNDIYDSHFIWPVSTTNLNSKVDILAPSMDTFSYGQYLINDTISYRVMATSPAAPHVTGTIGLMLDLNPCLTFEEVQSILKLSSNNIDHIEANQPYAGHYGSGSLNTHKAVKMVFDMITPGEIVQVENQIFSRWDFILESAPERIEMRNQIFEGAATAVFKAKESIELISDVDLRPSSNIRNSGFVDLSIDTFLLACSPSHKNRKNPEKNDNNIKIESIQSQKQVLLYPNPNEGSFTIVVKDVDIEHISVTVFDSFGKLVYSGDMTSAQETFSIYGLASGVYIVRLKGSNLYETIKFVKN